MDPSVYLKKFGITNPHSNIIKQCFLSILKLITSFLEICYPFIVFKTSPIKVAHKAFCFSFNEFANFSYTRLSLIDCHFFNYRTIQNKPLIDVDLADLKIRFRPAYIDASSR